MLTFISFAYRTIHEQQLLSSKPIARYLYEYGAGIVETCPNTQFAGVLGSSQLDFLPDYCPQTKFGIFERTTAESMAIQDRPTTQKNEWVVVVRPAQGYISRERLESFCTTLADIPIDSDMRDTGAYATSVIQHCSLTHPFWNLRAAPRHLFCDNGIRISLDESVMRDTIEQACPRLWKRFKADEVHRSQDAPPLLYGDQTLYAYFVGRQGMDSLSELPQLPIVYSCDEEGEAPLFYRLPTFTMSSHQRIDVAPLERLVCKQKATQTQAESTGSARYAQNLAAVVG